jgi:hypothetical protein
MSGSPGPWRLRRSGHFLDVLANDDDGTPVASVFRRRTVEGDMARQDADGRLIANAPAMRDLLISSHELLSDWLARSACGDDCDCILQEIEAVLGSVSPGGAS